MSNTLTFDFARDTVLSMTKRKSKPALVRQGDVLLLPIEVTCDELELIESAGEPGAMLAEGETSGHTHRLFGAGAKLMRYKNDGRRVVVAEMGAEVRVVGGESTAPDGGVVPRHEPIVLAPGMYEIRIQRSYADGYSRQVAD